MSWIPEGVVTLRRIRVCVPRVTVHATRLWPVRYTARLWRPCRRGVSLCPRRISTTPGLEWQAGLAGGARLAVLFPLSLPELAVFLPQGGELLTSTQLRLDCLFVTTRSLPRARVRRVGSRDSPVLFRCWPRARWRLSLLGHLLGSGRKGCCEVARATLATCILEEVLVDLRREPL